MPPLVQELLEAVVLARDVVGIVVGVFGTLFTLGSFSWYQRRIHHGMSGRKCRKDGLYYAQHDPSHQIVIEKGEIFPLCEGSLDLLFSQSSKDLTKTVWIYLPPP